MQRKPLAIFTLVLAALLAVWRVLLLPVAAGDGRTLTELNIPLFAVLLIAVALLLILGRSKRPFAPLCGNGAVSVRFAGAAFAAVLAADSLYALVAWVSKNVSPPPAVSAAAQTTERVLLPVVLFSGLLSAAFLFAWVLKPDDSPTPGAGGAVLVAITGVASGIAMCFIAVRLHKTAQLAISALGTRPVLGVAVTAALGLLLAVACAVWYLRRRWSVGWLWLAPTVWMFARLARYNVLYATAVDVTPLAYDAVLFCVALVFLFAFGCYMSGVQKTTRFMRGLAAATAALSLAAVLSRMILTLLGFKVAAAYCPLPDATDAMLGIFALAVAAAVPCEQPKDPE